MLLLLLCRVQYIFQGAESNENKQDVVYFDNKCYSSIFNLVELFTKIIHMIYYFT